MVKGILNLALIDRTIAFIDSRKKKLVESTSPVTFLDATAIAALSSWKVNVLSLS